MALIGISGKIGNGKDLIGKIIKYLIDREFDLKNVSEKDFLDYYSDPQTLRLREKFKSSSWEIKKYAGKLKQMVCLLIGCTLEDLENDEFKNKPLGKEWDKWGIIRGPGNDDTIIDIQPDYKSVIERLKVRDKGARIEYIPMTPRLLMVLLGTECGREIIHPNVWVNALYADYTKLYSEFDPKQGFENNFGKDIYPKWIITDVRFENEAKAVFDRKGILIRVNRPCDQCGVIEGHKMIVHNPIPSKHRSETALDSYDKFKYVIENDGSIGELIKKIKEILINEKLI